MEDDQIEYNTDFPLGEGNFGIVYKGVLTKSDGDWEQVRTVHLQKKVMYNRCRDGHIRLFSFRSFVNDPFRSVFFNRSEKKTFFSKRF